MTVKEYVENHVFTVLVISAVAVGFTVAGIMTWICSSKSEIAQLLHQQTLQRSTMEFEERRKELENSAKLLEGKLASIERGIGAGNFIDVQKLFERQTLGPSTETRFYPGILAFGQTEATGWRVREIDELALARDWVIESRRASRDELARELSPYSRRSVAWDLPDMSIAFEGHNVYQKLVPSIVVARFSKSQYIDMMIKHEQLFADQTRNTRYNAAAEKADLGRRVEADFAGTAFLRWLSDLNGQSTVADTSVHIGTIQRKNGVLYADVRFVYGVVSTSQATTPTRRDIYLFQEIFMRQVNDELVTITVRVPTWEPSQTTPAFARVTQALENFRFMDRQR